MYDEAPRSQNLNIKIGNTTFQNLTDLKQFVASIIKNPKYELSALNQTVDLSPEHSKFMSDLLSYHPRAQQKLKNYTKILLGSHQIGTKSTRCFFIEKNASFREDISYLKACDAAYDATAAEVSQYLLNDNQKLQGENILNFLVRLFKLYPLSLNHLSPILKEVFPHRRLDEDIQRVFLLNILKLTIVRHFSRTVPLTFFP